MENIKKIFMTHTSYALFLLKAIMYEGQDKNPEMCRVLLTHEVMCRYVKKRRFTFYKSF